MELPLSIVIDWYVRHVSSNSELARISNVSHAWRKETSQVLLRQAIQDVFQEDENPKQEEPSPLLLPCMIRTIFELSVPSSSSLWRKKKGRGNSTTQTEEVQDRVETFCAAWFPPEGILTVHVSSQPLDESDEEDFQESFSPSGAPSYEGSEEDRRMRGGSLSPATSKTSLSRHQRSTHSFPSNPFHTITASNNNTNGNHPGENDSTTLCCWEWRGFREATDVLEPFGYSRNFVQQLIAMAMEQARPENIAQRQKQMMMGTAPEPNSKTDNSSTNTAPTQDKIAHSTNNKSNGETRSREPQSKISTYAVRGATFARPEGYCLCVDPSEDYDPDNHGETEMTTHDYYHRTSMHRRQRRKLVQRQLLPRVVASNPTKDPFQPQEPRLPELPFLMSPPPPQKPCVQFLNASGYNAVRMVTPAFECGTINGGITIICVGIATEDGCFMSGLRRRCEFGHMYPPDERDTLIDMSPVCVTMEKRKAKPGAVSATGCASYRSFGSARSISSEFDSDYDDDDDSSCGSSARYDSESRHGMRCTCPFSVVSRLQYRSGNNNANVPEDCIHRGRRGPGVWHCYTAVIGNGESIIRIDGQLERVTSTPPKDGEVHTTLLDGLTIGSDHTFDMSLCCGQGSDEEGEGAIAELVVFKGRLPLTDIELLENHIMKKHGIRHALPGSELFLEEEDESRRQARALIAQTPPFNLIGKRVPLRHVARDPAVAWHRTNAVTGERVSVGRIGSRMSTGSSDW